MFEVTGDKDWLHLSEKMTAYTFDHFYDEKSGLFYFAEKNENSLVTNHFQKEDNVLSASNSVMANNLHQMYLIYGRPEYLTMAKKMLQHITPQFAQYPMAFANWGTLMLKTTEPYFEVAISGENAGHVFNEMKRGFQPNILWAFSKSNSAVPLLKDRLVKGKTLIYVCEEGVCQLPVETVQDAFKITSVQ